MNYFSIREQRLMRATLFAGCIIIGSGPYLFAQQDVCKQDVRKTESLSSQIWRPVQQQVGDTVVQIFVQVAEFDIAQPFKTPSQAVARGSGFFIDAQGHIATNAHVVENALAAVIQIPSLGKQWLDVTVVGICPERDLALLKLSDKSYDYVMKNLGAIPFLTLGNSDSVYRADEVLALGYPLGQEKLKSTTGVVSGHEQHMIQTSAPINPGNSGGPLLNLDGEVIGINSAGINSNGAQNIGYAIPVNDFKIIIPDLKRIKLLRKPYLGIIHMNATDCMTTWLGNPQPGGCYINAVIKNGPLCKAGIKKGDMIYEIDGYRLDMYGEMSVPWSEDKISVADYVSRLVLGVDVHVVVYRNGERLEFVAKFDEPALLPIRKIYPHYEQVDFEAIAGMVVMPLTINHIVHFVNNHEVSGLMRYLDINEQTEPALVMSHIFPNSQLQRSRTVSPGAVLKTVNGQPVSTLEEFREAIQLSVSTGYLILEAKDYSSRSADTVLIVLPLDKVIEEEETLSRNFRYPLSETAKTLARAYQQAMAGETITSPLSDETISVEEETSSEGRVRSRRVHSEEQVSSEEQYGSDESEELSEESALDNVLSERYSSGDDASDEYSVSDELDEE